MEHENVTYLEAYNVVKPESTFRCISRPYVRGMWNISMNSGCNNLNDGILEFVSIHCVHVENVRAIVMGLLFVFINVSNNYWQTQNQINDFFPCSPCSRVPHSFVHTTHTCEINGFKIRACNNCAIQITSIVVLQNWCMYHNAKVPVCHYIKLVYMVYI